VAPAEASLNDNGNKAVEGSVAPLYAQSEIETALIWCKEQSKLLLQSLYWVTLTLVLFAQVEKLMKRLEEKDKEVKELKEKAALLEQRFNANDQSLTAYNNYVKDKPYRNQVENTTVMSHTSIALKAYTGNLCYFSHWSVIEVH